MKPLHLRSGFALLSVLWCLGVMGLAAGGVMLCVSLRLDEAVGRNEEDHARRLALSGLAVGLHPLVHRDDPLLVRENAREGYRVVLHGENGRLNINTLLRENRTDILDRFWTLAGLASDEAQRLDDCLLDWIESGDLRRLNGAKQPEYARLGYPDYPPGRPFQSVDEMAAVIGFAKVEKGMPRWRECFTLYGGGKIDLNEAPVEVLAAVGDVPLDAARQFIAEREAARANGTSPRWQNPEEAAAILGMAPNVYRNTSPLLTLQSTLWRIESTGHVGKRTRTIDVVSAKDGNGSDPYLWREH